MCFVFFGCIFRFREIYRREVIFIWFSSFLKVFVRIVFFCEEAYFYVYLGKYFLGF